MKLTRLTAVLCVSAAMPAMATELEVTHWWTSGGEAKARLLDRGPGRGPLANATLGAAVGLVAADVRNPADDARAVGQGAKRRDDRRQFAGIMQVEVDSVNRARAAHVQLKNVLGVATPFLNSQNSQKVLSTFS